MPLPNRRILTCASIQNSFFIIVTSFRACLYFQSLERPYRLAVRTPPFHGGGTGSIPVRVAILLRAWSVSRRLGQGRIRPQLFDNSRQMFQQVLHFRLGVVNAEAEADAAAGASHAAAHRE